MVIVVDKFKWIEKDARACLIQDEDTLLWWGNPEDDLIPPHIAPVKVLLEISVERKKLLDQADAARYTS